MSRRSIYTRYNFLLNYYIVVLTRDIKPYDKKSAGIITAIITTMMMMISLPPPPPTTTTARLSKATGGSRPVCRREDGRGKATR